MKHWWKEYETEDLYLGSFKALMRSEKFCSLAMAMFNDKHHHPLRLAVVPCRNDRPEFWTDNFAAIIIIMIIRTCELDMICIIIVFTITITRPDHIQRQNLLLPFLPQNQK